MYVCPKLIFFASLFTQIACVCVCVKKLLWCREELCQQAECTDLELSMGMTDDYEHAVSAYISHLQCCIRCSQSHNTNSKL